METLTETDLEIKDWTNKSKEKCRRVFSKISSSPLNSYYNVLRNFIVVLHSVYSVYLDLLCKSHLLEK